MYEVTVVGGIVMIHACIHVHMCVHKKKGDILQPKEIQSGQLLHTIQRWWGEFTIRCSISCCLVASCVFKAFSLLFNSSTCRWSLLSESFNFATSLALEDLSFERRESM